MKVTLSEIRPIIKSTFEAILTESTYAEKRSVNQLEDPSSQYMNVDIASQILNNIFTIFKC